MHKMIKFIGEQKYWTTVNPKGKVPPKKKKTNLESSAAPPTFKIKPIQVNRIELEAETKATFISAKKLRPELKRIADYDSAYKRAAAAAKNENAKLYPTSKK